MLPGDLRERVAKPGARQGRISTRLARVLNVRYNRSMTERQQAILAAIIEQYAEIAAPVGSVTLAKLFGVSSATIRNEMAKLEEMGFIEAPHTSAGRIPTDKGYRLYVNGITDAQMTELPSGIDRSARAIEAHVNSHVDTSDRAIVCVLQPNLVQ